jgi:hypothetical protein
MWAGQAAGLGRAMPARALTLQLVEESQEVLRKMAQ